MRAEEKAGARERAGSPPQQAMARAGEAAAADDGEGRAAAAVL